MLINKILNAFMDSRNLGREFNGKKALNKLEFISGRYHVLREICQNFDRISSVKRTSLYLQSRAGPAEKHASRVHNTKLWLGPQTTTFTQPKALKQFINNINQKYEILIIR